MLVARNEGTENRLEKATMRKAFLVAILAFTVAGGISAPMPSWVGWHLEILVRDSRTGLGYDAGSAIGIVLGQTPFFDRSILHSLRLTDGRNRRPCRISCRGPGVNYLVTTRTAAPAGLHDF